MSKRKELKLLKSAILHDFVLLKPIIVEISGKAKIVKPQQYEDKPEYGEVILVGQGRLMPDGSIKPLNVKIGQTVLFQKYSTEKVRDPDTGVDYVLVKEEDIRLILS